MITISVKDPKLGTLLIPDQITQKVQHSYLDLRLIIILKLKKKKYSTTNIQHNGASFLIHWLPAAGYITRSFFGGKSTNLREGMQCFGSAFYVSSGSGPSLQSQCLSGCSEDFNANPMRIRIQILPKKDYGTFIS